MGWPDSFLWPTPAGSSPQNRGAKFFRLDSRCPCCVILWAHEWTTHGGERFQRADQTGWHRHGARAVFRAALQHRDLAVKTHWHKLFLPLLRWLVLATGLNPSRSGRPVVFSVLCGFGLAAASVCPAGTNSTPSAPRYEIRAEHDPNGIGKFYMGREIAGVMGHQAADWLERPERQHEERTDLLVPVVSKYPKLTGI